MSKASVVRVGVLGAGTMGARIAAHFANAGVPALLLDLDTAAAKKGIENAAKLRPGGFYLDSLVPLVTPGSFERDLPALTGCDWIIEAVKEDLGIKRELWQRVAAVANPQAIFSTNTSGIPLQQIVAGFPEEFQRRFLGTHFFNPPRYLHLLELIPGPATAPEILSFVEQFVTERLGKGVVPCRDTPNFIANRLGCFFGATVAKIAFEDGYTVEETDALTGSLIGFPSTASFRLLDVVGLDVMVLVAENLRVHAASDPWRERFATPPVFAEMVQRGWLGEKTGQGFYRRVGPHKEIQALDWRTLEYHSAVKVRFPEADAVRGIEDWGARLRELLATNGRAGQFLWKLLSDYFLYAAERAPEIADRLYDVDRAMRWGYAHPMGPFEMWDAIGLEHVCDRLLSEDRPLPELVETLRRHKHSGFYAASGRSYFDLAQNTHQPVPAPGLLLRQTNVIRSNAGTSLRDLGDGVYCVEFHSKMNTIGFDQMEMIEAALASDADALVIGNQGDTYSAGANLILLLLAAQDEDWDQIGNMIRRFQDLNQSIKYSVKPVVAAPFGRALGGGCEVPLHAIRVQASAETYMGLVEVGVGLIPAAGGCKEMLARFEGNARRVFEIIGQAQVSTSAANARMVGYLRQADGISINPDRLLDDAKRVALALAPGYAPPVPQAVPVGGDAAYAMIKLGVWTYAQGGYITEYDQVLGEKLAHILSGGRGPARAVSEQYLLDLEREAFLSLCGDRRSQDRISHMLKTGKPLRN